MIYVQLLFFAVVAFFAYAYYEGWKDEKKLAGRLDRGLFPEDYGWIPDRSLVNGSWLHIESRAMLRPSVTRQCFELSLMTIEDGDYHYEPAKQVNESGKLDKYIIPFPLLKEDLDKLDKIVNPDRSLKPVFLETYLRTESAV
jgi:hypothetical protein